MAMAQTWNISLEEVEKAPLKDPTPILWLRNVCHMQTRCRLQCSRQPQDLRLKHTAMHTSTTEEQQASSGVEPRQGAK